MASCFVLSYCESKISSSVLVFLDIGLEMVAESCAKSIAGLLAFAMALHGLLYWSGKIRDFSESFGDIVTEGESRVPGSNRRPMVYKTIALPLS